MHSPKLRGARALVLSSTGVTLAITTGVGAVSVAIERIGPFGLYGAEQALCDDLRRQSIQCALDGVTCIDLIALEPGFAVLPMHVVAK